MGRGLDSSLAVQTVSNMIPAPASAPHLPPPGHGSSPQAQVCALAFVSPPVPPTQPVSARELCRVRWGPA